MMIPMMGCTYSPRSKSPYDENFVTATTPSVRAAKRKLELARQANSLLGELVERAETPAPVQHQPERGVSNER
jgi:hypothetical protein